MEDIYQLGVDAVQIGVLDGLRCLIVERISGSRSMEVLSRPGARLPLHATGVGKVLLAYGGDELQAAALAKLERFTVQTITDAEPLRQQLQQIKQQAFASTKEEMALGAISIAVPIRGYGGKVIAALGVVLATRNRDYSHLAPVLKVTAEALSRKLVAAGFTDAAGLRPGGK